MGKDKPESVELGPFPISVSHNQAEVGYFSGS